MKRYRIYVFNSVLVKVPSYTLRRYSARFDNDSMEDARKGINNLEKARPEYQFVIVDYPQNGRPKIIYVTP
jgi:hypothetical protein